MGTPKELKPGDACPNCGGAFAPAPVPSDAQRAAATPHLGSDTYTPIPPHYDTAPPDQIADLGALYVCRGCGYKTRFAAKAAKAAKKGDDPAA